MMKRRNSKKKNKRFQKLKVKLIIAGILAAAFFVVFVISLVAAAFNCANHKTTEQNTESSDDKFANFEGNVSDLSVSKNLIAFLESWEGYAQSGYRGQDSWNVTIGYGHVVRQGENFGTLAKPEAEELLISDLKKEGYCGFIDRKFSKCSLNQNQKDALVSLAYNIGTDDWDNLSLTNDIMNNASDDKLQSDFEAICHVGGIKSEGLLRRRHAEWIMFTSGIYTLNS